MFDNLLFKTNYSKDPLKGGIADSLQKFDLPTDAAFRIFPRRKMWQNGIEGSYGIEKGVWTKPEYDFYEVGRILDTEALFQQAIQKKHTLIFKEGWHIQSDNTTNLNYIKRRLSEAEYVSNTYMSKLMKEVVFNLLTFHNVIVLKVRKKNASSGNTRKWKGQGREIAPVAGYFILPVECMEYKVDEYGIIQKWRQKSSGYYIEYDPKDIVHISFNKRSGFVFAPPPTEAVKDDIIALRKIEESIESLIYKVLFPIIHVKVGTKESPAKMLPDGISEVSIATRLLQQLDDAGGIATSERVEVDVIGAESQALRVEAYLKYFKQRVYSGLGMSSLDYGDLEGSGAAAGDYVTSALKTLIFAYQDEIADAFTRCILDELLLEKGKGDKNTYEHAFEIDDESRVYFSFSEADIDNLIKKENHTLNKVNSDLLTTDEARKELKKRPLKDDNINALHTVRVQANNEERQAKITKDLAKHDASLVPPSTTTSVTKKATNGASTTTKTTKTGTSKSQPSKKSGASGAAKSATKPTNQYSKDWLIGRVFRVMNNNDLNKEYEITKAIADYVTWKVSNGYIDPRETSSLQIPDVKEFAEQHASTILDGLVDLTAKEINNPILLNKKKDIVISRTIDKIENYVNNIG